MAAIVKIRIPVHIFPPSFLRSLYLAEYWANSNSCVNNRSNKQRLFPGTDLAYYCVETGIA